MRIFLSHAASDGAIAKYLKAQLEDVGVTIFMLPDDAPPGLPWMEQIKAGLNTSDELLSLMTPDSLGRPWMAAEWACFWQRDLPTTPLLVEVSLGDLWEPMTQNQGVNLLDPAQVMVFFDRFASITNIQPVSGVLPLAKNVSRQIPEIISRTQLQNVSEAIARISHDIQNGAENIRESDVVAAISANRIHDIVTLATDDRAAPVKQRQVAVALVNAGRPGEAFKIATCIHNRNEIKNIVFALLDVTNPSLGEESEEWVFLKKIFEYLGEPQRRNIRERMADLKLYPHAPWFSVA